MSERERADVPANRLRADASRTVRRGPLVTDGRPQRGSRRVRGASPSRARRSAVRTFALILDAVIAILVVAVVACAGLLVLRGAGAFAVRTLEVTATRHLTEDDIARLANVGQGTTLIEVDTDAVAERVASDPWVEDVEVERVLPDTLRIVVSERAITEVVLMSSGQIAWYVGEGDVWVEPVSVTSANGQTTSEAALEVALDADCVLVSGVPATVEPVAGSVVTDDSLVAVGDYLEELPEDLVTQIVSFSAPSDDAISCVLANGVEVSLGSPVDITSKGNIVLQLLEEHEGEITYINVRSVTDPSYRRISSDSVQPGTGMVSSEE